MSTQNPYIAELERLKFSPSETDNNKYTKSTSLGILTFEASNLRLNEDKSTSLPNISIISESGDDIINQQERSNKQAQQNLRYAILNLGVDYSEVEAY